MRTVIFAGLLLIADSIGAKTGWKMTQGEAYLGTAIFVGAIVCDLVDMFR